MRNVYLKFDLKQSITFSIILIFLYIYLQDFVLSNKDLFAIKLSFILFLQLFSAVILILFMKIENLFKFNLFKKISTLVSKQTYSVYLTHMILIYSLIDLDIDISTKFIIYLFLLIAISTISYYFIEKPILKTRPKYL
jgi:peptidoglycan/LPS O-acetylase OafA/YrhL